jgi:hypothetical protein
MEYTNEFLMGMFAAYMGCEVQSKISGKTYKTIGIRYKESCFIICTGYTASKDELHLYPKNLIPILTPLSEISDDDAVEVAKIMKIPQHERAKLFGCDENNYYTIGRHIRKEIIETCLVDVFYLQGAVIDYLRSKKYDCGYLHISSLITAGLAVKATK